MTIFIIEHLEPKLSRWCLIEYDRINRILGKENLWFTNLKNKSDRAKLSKLGKSFKESVRTMGLKYSCVLDPESDKTLTTRDGERFRYLILGGILGDYPPKKRTNNELTKFLLNVETRNIGKKQFSTDNAVLVAKEILNGESLDGMKFQDKLEISINDVESVILPFCYPLIDGKPSISDELVKLLKKKKSF